MDIFASLSAPFPPDRISWRVGSMTKDKSKARALAYIDARDVMQRLDEIVGPQNWQSRYPHVGTITVCEIGLKVDGEWLWKANGAGHTDIEAEKGALSDAFKRAAVLWGIGQYLYDIDSPWVQVNEWKQIAEHELPRLHALLPGGETTSARSARASGDYQRIEKALRECQSLDDLASCWKKEQTALKKLPAGWQSSLTQEKDRIKETLKQPEAA